jgi:nucleoside-diphosphate-sugar epimerase
MIAKPTILLTGISGFLGSAIAEKLSAKYNVIGLIRKGSNLWRLSEINQDNIKLLDIESSTLDIELIKLKPTILIHSAWNGVAAGDREDWTNQIQNIVLTTNLLSLAKQIGIKKIIGLGSQAEYGDFEGKIDESFSPNPLSAYGASKLATMQIVQSFCNINKIEFVWLRLFPLYGEREDENWFIPIIIQNALQNKSINLTGCEQKYGYLHITDFAKAIEQVVINSYNSSGVYNLSSHFSIQLKSIVELIIKETKTTGHFNFGALPYRPNQVMHMEGNSNKFYTTFNFSVTNNLEKNIINLIKYYQTKKEKNNEISSSSTK